MSIQEIIIIPIILFCLISIGIKIYKSVKSINAGKSSCANCNSDCALRNQVSKKRPNSCPKGGTTKKTRHSCCG